MKYLYESNLQYAYFSFLNKIASFIGKRLDTQEIKDIVIDDKWVLNKSDMESTNGRYYFRDPEIYRKCYIPHADCPGVYIFFDENGTAVYVGKSEPPGGLGGRVASHIGSLDDNDFPNSNFPNAQYVIVIPFHVHEVPFLAPAFESYLLLHYTFEYNTQHQNHV